MRCPNRKKKRNQKWIKLNIYGGSSSPLLRWERIFPYFNIVNFHNPFEGELVPNLMHSQGAFVPASNSRANCTKKINEEKTIFSLLKVNYLFSSCIKVRRYGTQNWSECRIEAVNREPAGIRRQARSVCALVLTQQCATSEYKLFFVAMVIRAFHLVSFHFYSMS